MAEASQPLHADLPLGAAGAGWAEASFLLSEAVLTSVEGVADGETPVAGVELSPCSEPTTAGNR